MQSKPNQHVNVEDPHYKLANQDQSLVSFKKLQELGGNVCMEKLQNNLPCNEILRFESDTKECETLQVIQQSLRNVGFI